MATSIIKDLNAISPTIISGDDFPSNSYVDFDNTYTSLVYTRNMAIFQFNMTAKQEIAAYTIFLTLPDSIAPRVSLAIPIYRTGSFIGTMRIQSNGGMRPEMVIPNGTTFEGYVCFIR